MNFIYQLLLSVSEIAVAIVFLIAAKKMRAVQPKIRIKSKEADCLCVQIQNNSASSEDRAMQLLLTRGIFVQDHSKIDLEASSHGIIYPQNLSCAYDVIRGAKSTLSIFSNCRNRIYRQMLSNGQISGLIISSILDDRVGIVY